MAKKKKATASKPKPKKPAKPLKKAAPAAAKTAKAAAPAKAAKPGKAEAAKAGKADNAGKADKAAKPEKGAKPGKAGKEARPSAPTPMPSAPELAKKDPHFLGPPPDKQLPRASKLPAVAEALTKREMEQVLTVGVGRGVEGEGSLKGRLLVHLGFPYLEVIGRDKRELYFLLQGPDQEVLPAYLDHKVSVSGLIRRTQNYGGSVDVRKYSAKKPEETVVAAPAAPAPDKLRFLSPGEVEMASQSGMGSGMKGFAPIRGVLEMTGDEYFLVVSASGTRQQVSFTLGGKGAKGLKKHVGHTVEVTGVVEKTSGWGGTIDVETCESRPAERLPVTRDGLEITELDARGEAGKTEVNVNSGLSIRLPERAGFVWAIEPAMAKRLSLRESNFELKSGGGAQREFFFTPRNPGPFEVEFFLAKAHTPMQVSKTYRLEVMVKGGLEVRA
ncbi:MAG: transcriptional regulator [Myxococcaceae bacterium]